ncbi:MAG: lipoate--protein ligase [Eubacterium sp.]
MIWIETGSTDVYYNFGLEYYFTVEKRMPEPVFLFWQTTPTLMIGKYQNTREEIDLDYADAHGIHIVRRLSGGGTIYTDEGGWQYSFITQGDAGEIDFQKYLTPVLKALRDLGVPAEFNGRNDLTADGRKFSGTAQYKLKDATVHHGSLLFDTDVEAMVKATTVDEYKLVSKGIRSIRSRVCNLSEFLPEGMTAQEFKKLMVSAILGDDGTVYTVTPEDDARIRQLGDEKFRSWDAVYGHDPKFQLVQKKRFPGGQLRAALNVKKGKIDQIRFTGDFFSASDIQALEKRLQGVEFRKDEILPVVRESLAGGGIMGITPEQVVETIIE